MVGKPTPPCPSRERWRRGEQRQLGFCNGSVTLHLVLFGVERDMIPLQMFSRPLEGLSDRSPDLMPLQSRDGLGDNPYAGT